MSGPSRAAPSPSTPPLPSSSNGDRAGAQRKIRVVLVNDHPLTQEGIRACLAVAPHIEVAATTNDGAAALEHVRQHAPDVVVMDINLSGLNGLAATARLVREFPKVRVLVLTLHDHSEFIVEVIRAGARGCVPKDVTPPDFIRAIEIVAGGEAYFDLAETVRYLRRYRPAAPCVLAEPVKALTARESEVLALVGKGAPNREIARELKIAIRTVETHRERLMRKLDIHDQAALRSYATAYALLAEADTPDAH